MNIKRSVSVNGRLSALEDMLGAQATTLAGFDLYLRSVEMLLLEKKLVSKEELETVRNTVIKEYLAKLKPSQIVMPK